MFYSRPFHSVRDTISADSEWRLRAPDSSACKARRLYKLTVPGGNRVRGIKRSERGRGGVGVGGGNGDGNGVGGGNGDVNGHGTETEWGRERERGWEVNEGAQDRDKSGDGAGAGTGTGVETRRRAPEGNGDGDGDGSEDSSGDESGDEDNGNGNGNEDRIGEGEREAKMRKKPQNICRRHAGNGEDLGGKRKKYRKERAGPVAANADNLESNKEAGGGAQDTHGSSKNCTSKENVSPWRINARGIE